MECGPVLSASERGVTQLREQAVRASERKRWAGASGQARERSGARDATGLSAWRESGACCLRREWERLCARAGPERVRSGRCACGTAGSSEGRWQAGPWSLVRGGNARCRASGR